MRQVISTCKAIAATIAVLAIGVGCDQISDAIDENKGVLNVPIETDYTFPTAFDVGAATGALAGQKAPDKMEKDLSAPAQDVDLVKEAPALKDAKGRVKSLEITKIVAKPKSNSVTGVLPSFDIYIGALGNEDLSKAFKIATIPPIPAGSTANVNATIDSQGTADAQQHLITLAFSQFVVAKMVIEKGDQVPGGKADLDVTLGLKAVLNPIK